MSRDHDVVLFGATGFTGGLTAEYLARTAPPDCRWALAGRNLAKLESRRAELARINPACVELPLLVVDAADAAGLAEVAASAEVVASTVGPYVLYGEALVAACAEAGTDYVDLTGEFEFVDNTYVRHHRRAQETGARLVHCCGFDSIPYDLGVHYLVGQLPEGVPLTVDGFIRGGGRMSGGTFASALTAFSRPKANMAAAKARRQAEGSFDVRSSRVKAGPGRFQRAREIGLWGVPLPTIDPKIVGRSAVAIPRYGPDFRYRHHAGVKRLPVVAGGLVAVAMLMLAAQVAPVRRWLQTRLAPGDGPSAEQRAKSWFSLTLIGEGGGRRVIAEVAGGDPGYGETAKMLAESALCLAYDDLPETSGQVTTAAAMGDALTARLIRAGITFRVLQ